MNKVVVCIALIVAITVLIVLLSTGLPNGYSVVQANKNEQYIIDSSYNVVVGPHVTKWQVQGDQITGKLSGGKTFVLDSDTGMVRCSDGLVTNGGRPSLFRNAPNGYEIYSDGNAFSIVDNTGSNVGPVAFKEYESSATSFWGPISKAGNFQSIPLQD
jgi:hypothetical protein